MSLHQLQKSKQQIEQINQSQQMMNLLDLLKDLREKIPLHDLLTIKGFLKRNHLYRFISILQQLLTQIFTSGKEQQVLSSLEGNLVQERAQIKNVIESILLFLKQIFNKAKYSQKSEKIFYAFANSLQQFLRRYFSEQTKETSKEGGQKNIIKKVTELNNKKIVSFIGEMADSKDEQKKQILKEFQNLKKLSKKQRKQRETWINAILNKDFQGHYNSRQCFKCINAVFNSKYGQTSYKIDTNEVIKAFDTDQIMLSKDKKNELRRLTCDLLNQKKGGNIFFGVKIENQILTPVGIQGITKHEEEQFIKFMSFFPSNIKTDFIPFMEYKLVEINQKYKEKENQGVKKKIVEEPIKGKFIIRLEVKQIYSQKKGFVTVKFDKQQQKICPISSIYNEKFSFQITYPKYLKNEQSEKLGENIYQFFTQNILEDVKLSKNKIKHTQQLNREKHQQTLLGQFLEKDKNGTFSKKLINIVECKDFQKQKLAELIKQCLKETATFQKPANSNRNMWTMQTNSQIYKIEYLLAQINSKFTKKQKIKLIKVKICIKIYNIHITQQNQIKRNLAIQSFDEVKLVSVKNDNQNADIWDMQIKFKNHHEAAIAYFILLQNSYLIQFAEK